MLNYELLGFLDYFIYVKNCPPEEMMSEGQGFFVCLFVFLLSDCKFPGLY